MREIPSPGSDPSVFGDSLNASLRVSCLLLLVKYKWGNNHPSSNMMLKIKKKKRLYNKQNFIFTYVWGKTD